MVDQYREQAALTFAADGSCDPVPEEPGGSQDEPEDPQGQGSLPEKSGETGRQTGCQKISGKFVKI